MKIRIIASTFVLSAAALFAISPQPAAASAHAGGSCCICVAVIGDTGTTQQTCPCDSSYGGNYCRIQGSSCATVGTCGNPDSGQLPGNTTP